MRKTAISLGVAASLLATTALAQDIGEGISISISAELGVGFRERVGSSDVDASSFINDFKVDFAGSGMTDNGLTFGAAGTFEAEDGAADAVPAVVDPSGPLFRARFRRGGCDVTMVIDDERPAPLEGPAAAAAIGSGRTAGGEDRYVSIVARDAATERCDRSSFINDFKVDFASAATTDNGLSFRAALDLEEKPRSDLDDLDDLTAFISGAFGTLAISDAEDEADYLASPGAAGAANVDYDYRFIDFGLGAAEVGDTDHARVLGLGGEILGFRYKASVSFSAAAGYQGALTEPTDNGAWTYRIGVGFTYVAGADIDRISSKGPGGIGTLTGEDGDASVYYGGVTLGLGYQFSPELVGGNGFTIYAEAGPVYGVVNVDGARSDQSGDFLDDSDSALGYKIGFGLSVPVYVERTTSVSVWAGYSFTALNGVELTASSGVKSDDDWRLHQVSGGLRFGF